MYEIEVISISILYLLFTSSFALYKYYVLSFCILHISNHKYFNIGILVNYGTDTLLHIKLTITIPQN
jgi:hypothetical protein